MNATEALPGDISEEERKAVKQVREIRSFYIHAIVYAAVNTGLAVIDLLTGPALWFFWSLFGWGIGLAAHGLCVFRAVTLFGREWEQREVEKRLAKARRNRKTGP